jgi:hypothetical protein
MAAGLRASHSLLDFMHDPAFDIGGMNASSVET